jgi:hypothetical protein
MSRIERSNEKYNRASAKELARADDIRDVCPYGVCRCRDLCRHHHCCVRKEMEKDGWDLVNGEFVPHKQENLRT